MKKIISLTAVAALFLSCFVSASASTAGVFTEDFEGSISVGAALAENSVLSNPTGFVSVVDTADSNYQNAIQLKSDAKAQTDAGVRVSPEMSSEKFMVSFDIRPHQTNQEVRMLFNIGWLLGAIEGEKSTYTLYLSKTGEIKFSQTGTYDSMKSTGKTYAENEWMHVDMQVSLGEEKRKISYYINGEFVGESDTLSSDQLTSKVIKGLVFEMQATEGPADGSAKLDIDNISVTDAKKAGFFATASKGEGYIDVSFSESVKDINTVSVESIEKVNGGDGVLIGSYEAIGYNKLRVYYDGTLESGEEYRVTLGEGVTSIFGNTKSSMSCYFSVDYEAEKVLFEADGENEAPTPMVYLGANQDNPVSTDEYASYQDKGGNLGTVLEIKGDDAYEVNVGFALDEATEGKQIKLNYDLYACQQNQAFTQYTNRWIMGWNDNDNGPAYGLMLNHQISFALSNNAHHCWSNTGATTKWPQYSANTKYEVEIIYDFGKRTVTTAIGGVTADYLPLSGTMSADVLKSNSIKSICFSVNNGNLPGTNVSTGANPGDSVFYIDNIKISDITPVPYVKSIRFTGCSGETVLPDKKINPAVGKVNIEFSSQMDIESVQNGLILSDSEDNIELEYEGEENNVYTFKIKNGALNPNNQYTLNMFGAKTSDLEAEAPDYTFEFETTDGEFSVSVLKWEQNGDTAVLDVRIVNTSGKDKTAVVTASALRGNKMTEFDMRMVDLSQSLYFEDTITFTVSEGDVACAYVFDSMEKLNLLHDVAELK